MLRIPKRNRSPSSNLLFVHCCRSSFTWLNTKQKAQRSAELSFLSDLDRIAFSILKSSALKIKNPQNQKSKLYDLACFLIYPWPRQDCFQHPDKAPLWKSKSHKIKKASFMILLAFWFIRDPDRIQTCNPQSRNLMRYSVAPRGLINYWLYKFSTDSWF